MRGEVKGGAVENKAVGNLERTMRADLEKKCRVHEIK